MLLTTKNNKLGYKAVTAGLVCVLTLTSSYPITAAYAAQPSEIQAASDKIDSLAAELKDCQNSLDENEGNLQKLATEIVNKEQEITQTTQKLDAAKEVLSKRVRSSYKSGVASMLELIMGSTSMEDLVSRIHYMDSVSQEDARTINDVRDLSRELASQKSALEEQQAKEKAQGEKLQSQIDDIQSKLSEAQSYYNSLSAEAQAAIQKQAENTDSQAAYVIGAIQENSDNTQSAAGNSSAQSNNQNDDHNDGGSSSTPSPSRSNSYSDAGGPVANAYQFLGKGYRYIWGSSNPSNGGFDCSGFTQYIFRLSGYSISRTTWTQRDEIKAKGNWKTSPSQLVAGDLVFFNGCNHVGIYVGGDQFIHSSSSRGPICVSLSGYLRYSSFYGGGSIL
ncbi:NlpC/P60 family protein [Fannyhessea vaginae]|jgi:nlpC/P60 family protein|uniref:C40 family peptidase n=1 Tax=Fannyhessea vaginae TaxID=82135 RepID=UPI0023F4F6A7|nr:NlpC/P60 family protein [Fannyhessea vaginae]